MDDDGVRVEVETDGDEETDPLINDHPASFKPASEEFIFRLVSTYVAQYGWALLVGAVVCWWLAAKALDYYRTWSQEQQDREKARLESQNPDLVYARQEAMVMAHSRLQAQHDARVAEFLEKAREKEEKKRMEKISDWEKHKQGGGYRSKVKPKEEATPDVRPRPKPKLRTEYNPLMGDGGAAYRPSRSCDSGGG